MKIHKKYRLIPMASSNKYSPEMKEHSLLNIISYNFGQFASDFQGAFTGLYFFFYETEVFLGIWFITLANIIFAIWNAIDDPLLAYVTDRPTRFTKKMGKAISMDYYNGNSSFFRIHSSLSSS